MLIFDNLKIKEKNIALNIRLQLKLASVHIAVYYLKS